ncbi:Upc2 protein [Hypoxylon crocopeplum]|nr:Upc2 protein [Hypoxylon crocopeplum]
MMTPQPQPHKPRRKHQKSRNGCTVCKKRRVKCDESRPQCRNCVISERLCSYLEQSSGDHDAGRSHSILTPALSVSTVSGESIWTGDGDGQPDTGASATGTTFEAIHMILLHHAECNMASYMALQGAIRPIIDAAVNSALTAPYLLDQLLALSALHLSTQNTATSSLYHHHATELQTRALRLFNQSREDVGERNYMPTFLFATLLGIHVLRDTLAARHQDLGSFVGAYVAYARLHRGVRAVTSTHWDRILQSELKPLMYIAARADDIEKQARGSETELLRQFLETSELASSSVGACLDALRWVQWALDTAAREPGRFDVAVHATLAWALVVPDRYVEALYQHQPEALVVLAYYAAVLHRHRRCWVFGDAGSALVQSIIAHVGPFWADVLVWPQEVLSEG